MLGLDDAVIFSNEGQVSSGIVFTPNTTFITLNNSSIYAIWFFAHPDVATQFSLRLNGTLIAGARYGVREDAPNPGMVIVFAAAGSVLTLNNDTSGPVTLLPQIGGTALTTNASVQILRLA